MTLWFQFEAWFIPFTCKLLLLTKVYVLEFGLACSSSRNQIYVGNLLVACEREDPDMNSDCLIS